MLSVSAWEANSFTICFDSNTIVTSPFEIVHSDVWTFPISSISGMKHYLIFLDHYSHFLWVYPLHRKSELLANTCTFLIMCRPSYTDKSNLYNATMAGSMITACSRSTLPQQAHVSDSHAPTYRSKTVVPNI